MSEKHWCGFYKEGSSDKEYHVHLIAKGSGYSVQIEYGRRASSLTVSVKTPKPVDLDAATKIFEAAVHAKRLKGYTEAPGATPYVGGDKEQKITGVLPQLLNNVDEAKLEKLFDDPAWCMQEKKDGKRILLRNVASGPTEGINRKGLLVGIPESVALHCSKVTGTFLVDGELIGDVYWAFDILERDSVSLRTKTYSERWETLSQTFASVGTGPESAVQVVGTAFTSKEKRALYVLLQARGAEGLVAKLLGSQYTPGRPASNGNQLKYKFYATATVRVAGNQAKGKRSVLIQALDGKELVDVGKVTVLPNFDVPETGKLVEVKYLYRHVHGALYQPVYLGERDDLEAPDQVSSLKIKEGITVDEDEDN